MSTVGDIAFSVGGTVRVFRQLSVRECVNIQKVNAETRAQEAIVDGRATGATADELRTLATLAREGAKVAVTDVNLDGARTSQANSYGLHSRPRARWLLFPRAWAAKPMPRHSHSTSRQRNSRRLRTNCSGMCWSILVQARIHRQNSSADPKRNASGSAKRSGFPHARTARTRPTFVARVGVRRAARCRNLGRVCRDRNGCGN